jgi:hypothetical protein
MTIGRVAFNDPVANFFKAVETARQRNLSAFDQIQPAAKFETSPNAAVQKPASAVSLKRPFENKITGVNTAPAASAQSQRQVRTRILGNFFDAYA